MESQLRAFYLDYRYYLFPEEFEELSDLKRCTHVRVKHLKEEHCLAPDFLYEGIEELELELSSPERIFETRVNLYSAAEYDALLAACVKRVCPGCERYGENEGCEEDLEGHYHELGLSGVCYERIDEADRWDFATFVDVFWWRVAKEHAGALADCIDCGDQTKLNRILNRELEKFFTHARFYGSVEGGKYCLSFATAPGVPDVLQVLYCYLAKMGAADGGPMSEIGWEIRPFRAAGAYQGKILPEVPLLHAVEQDLGYVIVVYDRHARELTDRQKGNRMRAVDDYLCAAVGEDVVRTFVSGYAVSDDEPDATPAGIAERLLNEYKKCFGEPGDLSFPVPLPYSTSEELINAFPQRLHLTEGVTSCYQLSFFERTDFEAGIGWWLHWISFAYLYVPLPYDDPAGGISAVKEYLVRADMAPAACLGFADRQTACRSIGYANCNDEGYLIDFAVFSERKFYRLLRALAPMLTAIGAELIVVNREGDMHYRCGFDFMPV